MSEQTLTEQEKNKIVKDKILAIFPDIHTQNRAIDAIVSKRPVGWSRKSNAPYYNEFYGKRMKNAVDQMIISRQSIAFFYDTYCGNSQEFMSHQTLYNQVNQSIRFLIEKLDPDTIYQRWLMAVSIHRDRLRKGIIIEFKPEFRKSDDGEAIAPSFIEPEDKSVYPKWERKMDDWLESGKSEPFILEGLCLTSDEIAKVTSILKEAVGMQGIVTANKIKIIRVNE